mgnify:CR=1 FL=1
MHFLFDFIIFIVYSIPMIMKNIPTKNEMFAEFANCKNIDERIEYIKSLRDVDVNHTLNITVSAVV